MDENKKLQPEKKLTDKELAAKYDTGKKVDFKKIMNKLVSKKPNNDRPDK